MNAESQSFTRRQALQLSSSAAVLLALPQGALAASKGTGQLHNHYASILFVQMHHVDRMPYMSEQAAAKQVRILVHLHCLAAGPAGFNAAKDTQDGYQFVYPFGWQEVSVDGQDVVYKDIIEPLESASVSITKTDKASVTEFGNPLEVCT